MKKYIALSLLCILCISNLQSQIKKDTLFFNVDKYYTISPTITPYSQNETYGERLKILKKQMEQTKTNGYVLFIGNGYLIKDLKPKRIHSLKDFIENRKFYHDGKYNQIVDKWKLKDSLTDKYTIFFINDNNFIQPRHLEYNSYYPLRDDDKGIIHNSIKDTLFFKLDNDYIYKSKVYPNRYLLKENNSTQYVIFTQQEIIKAIKGDKPVSLKEFAHSSRFYNKDTKRLNEDDLAELLNDYVVFLVNDDKSKYIKVCASIMTED